MDKDLIQKFILDKDWSKMQSFIEGHFASNTDVNAIDTTLSPETVHAQVIAMQHITKKIEELNVIFDNAKQIKTSKPTSFK